MGDARMAEHRRWDEHDAPVDLEQARAGAEGFVQLLPGEESPQGSPLLIYPGMQLKEWFSHMHGLREQVGALGCHFMRDVVVREHALMFRDEKLLVEGTHLSDVSIQWADTYGIGESRPDRDTTRIAQPVINALGPGYLIYGHWIVDFIPRLAIAKALLGANFDEYKILLPSDAPAWVFQVSHKVLGIEDNCFLKYNPLKERLDCALLCAPTYAHGEKYGFHPFMREIYSSVAESDAPGTLKICISRKNFEDGTTGLWKTFDSRELFEATAKANGYEIVYPETMPFDAQIQLFAQAKVILGEYGSALHNSVFSRPGTVIGAVRCLNTVQSYLAAAFDQRCAYLIPESEWEDERGVQRYICSQSQIEEFIEFLETVTKDD